MKKIAVILAIVMVATMIMTGCQKKCYTDFEVKINDFLPQKSEIQEYVVPKCVLMDEYVVITIENPKMTFEVGYVGGKIADVDKKISATEVTKGEKFEIFKKAKKKVNKFFESLEIPELDVVNKLEELKLADICEITGEFDDDYSPAVYEGGKFIYATFISKAEKNGFDYENVLIHEMVHYLLNWNRESWFQKNGKTVNFWANEGMASLIADYITDTSFKSTSKVVFGYNRQINVIAVLMEIYGNDLFVDMLQGKEVVYNDMKETMGETNLVAFCTAFDQITLDTDLEKSAYLLNYVVNPIFQQFIVDKGYSYNVVELTDFA